MSSDGPISVTIKIAQPFEAMQFNGERNALVVLTWLRKRGYTAAWISKETGIYTSLGNRSCVIKDSEWVILGDSSIVVRTESQFKESYSILN